MAWRVSATLISVVLYPSGNPMIGCTVRDADTGADYGQVYDVRATGANDVYYLRDAAGRERLVPAIADVVLAKDQSFNVGKSGLVWPAPGLPCI